MVEIFDWVLRQAFRAAGVHFGQGFRWVKAPPGAEGAVGTAGRVRR